jgi:hypothetical protein
MTEQLYPWQAACHAPVVETDPTRLPVGIYEAQSACEERRLSPIGADEENALAEAEKVLRLLQNGRHDSSRAQS